MSAEFHIKSQDGIASLIVCNSGKRNAISRAMWQSLPDLLHRIRNTLALIVSGESGHFSAGADINEFATLQTDELEARRFFNEMQVAIHALTRFPAPVIAHVQGACFGAGVALALACDVRLADDTARFAIPPAKLGLLYPQGDIDRLTARIGQGQASRLLFTGKVIDSQEALRIGLVEQLANEEKARSMAKTVATLAPQALNQLKRQVQGRLADPDGAFVKCFSQKEFAEGLNAFANKRHPDYS